MRISDWSSDVCSSDLVAAGADLRDEVLVRDGDLTVLMAALFFVRDLVLDLERAGTGFYHLLREEVRRLGIAEARVDVGDDRHDVRLVIVDARLDLDRKSTRLNSSH